MTKLAILTGSVWPEAILSQTEVARFICSLANPANILVQSTNYNFEVTDCITQSGPSIFI